MHMADALLSPAAAGTMYACSGAACAFAIRKASLEIDSKKIPVMGVMGAFVFSAQMINFTIPWTGSSGHLCGGMLLSALLGPYAAFLAMVGVLLIQCLLFADGGLLALGANIWNIAFYGCFVGYFLIWRPMMRTGMGKRRIISASVLGSVLTLQLGALSVSLETLASGVSELPFALFAGTMLPIHLAIGLVEGLITAAVLLFVYEARPELLAGSLPEKKPGRLTLRGTLAALGIVTLLIGGYLSLHASSLPDGLEWSIARVTDRAASSPNTAESRETGKLLGADSPHRAANQIQKRISPLPDYAFSDSDSALGTSVSGIVGSLTVLGLCAGGCFGLHALRKRKACTRKPKRACDE